MNLRISGGVFPLLVSTFTWVIYELSCSVAGEYSLMCSEWLEIVLSSWGQQWFPEKCLEMMNILLIERETEEEKQFQVWMA